MIIYYLIATKFVKLNVKVSWIDWKLHLLNTYRSPTTSKYSRFINSSALQFTRAVVFNLG
jgi:hypothetical protein